MTKTHVSLRPAGLKRYPMQLLPDFVRLTYTDEKGRFQLAPAAPGAHILRPYTCLPQRLELRRDPKEVDVQVQVAQYCDVKFDVRDTRSQDPGVFNISLWGEIVPKNGGDPIPQLGLVFLNRAEKTILIRVPRALQNVELRMNNFLRQVVHITDESGKEDPRWRIHSSHQDPRSRRPAKNQDLDEHRSTASSERAESRWRANKGYHG